MTDQADKPGSSTAGCGSCLVALLTLQVFETLFWFAWNPFGIRWLPWNEPLAWGIIGVVGFLGLVAIVVARAKNR